MLWVCAACDKHPTLNYQRWSNNSCAPRFSEQEPCIVYLFGVLQGRFQQKAIHTYVRQPWGAWFAHWPSYQTFNQRLKLLSEVWPVLRGELWQRLSSRRGRGPGSMARLLAHYVGGARARRRPRRVAPEQADQSYGAAKQLINLSYHSCPAASLSPCRNSNLHRAPAHPVYTASGANAGLSVYFYRA